MFFFVVRINLIYLVSIIIFVDDFLLVGLYLVFLIEVVGVEYRMFLYCNIMDNGICVCVIVNLYRNIIVSLVNENYGNIFIYIV